MLLPVKLMLDRVELARSDGDTTLFLHLLYAGEMLVKIIASTFVGSIADNREKHRYDLLHRAIRADGLGEWGQILDESLAGPAAQYVHPSLHEDRRQLTQRVAAPYWQFECVYLMHSALTNVTADVDKLGDKVALRQWFSYFVQLRNKTRGHGAPTPAICSRIAPDLERSILMILDNIQFFRNQWAYLHRNLSGKFRVIGLTNANGNFDELKKATGSVVPQYRSLPDGVYIHLGEPVHVELINTDVDAADFYLPNGQFNGKTFELLSPISDDRKQGDATPYLAPSGARPQSETEGRGTLDIVGLTWSNIPAPASGYVQRTALETELRDILLNDRHPVATLIGRGGIGKTSLAISVCNQVAQEGRFEAIVWFSARDIDLIQEGPKVVTPKVLTQGDISKEFARLMGQKDALEGKQKPIDYLAENLTKSSLDKPILFVFDNFETVRNPGDLFNWLDNFVRLPNKILITTRQREFKADYPIQVGGMSDIEAEQLIASFSKRLAISEILTPKYVTELLEEADGHPYIIKVLLGEVAKAGKAVKIERIVASKDNILDALFERTYAGLHPVSKRIFLTLCSWRSLVPELAFEAILLRPSNDRMDVSTALDELVASSFVDRKKAADGTFFLDVALAAYIFGRRKLQISPMKAAIAADIEFLQQIGASSASSLKHGLKPRIERLFESIAARIGQGKFELDAILPSLEYVCRQYPPAWIMLARLHEEIKGSAGLDQAAECFRRFLEVPQPSAMQISAWQELARIYRLMNDPVASAQAIIQMSKVGAVPYALLSNVANDLNSFLRQHPSEIDSEEKKIIYQDLAQVMEQRIDEANATDLSRIAWLHLHLKNVWRAEKCTKDGIDLDPTNQHCLRLVARLKL